MRTALVTLASTFAIAATGHAIALWQPEGEAIEVALASRGEAPGAEAPARALVGVPAPDPATAPASQGDAGSSGDADAARDKRLAALYAAMPPDAAAPMIGALKPAQAASVLMLMPPHAAGAVLAALPPGRAAPLATALGG